MLVNSALELAPHDEEYRGLVCEQLGAIEAFFRRAVLAGQCDGSIGTQRPADELARHFLGILMAFACWPAHGRIARCWKA